MDRWVMVNEMHLKPCLATMQEHGLDDVVSLFAQVIGRERKLKLHETGRKIDDLPIFLVHLCAIVLADVMMHGMAFFDADDPDLMHAAFIVATRWPTIQLYARGRRVCLVHQPEKASAESAGGAS